ncbi:5-methyltetrahydrofolate--homocysteine methyltransferase [Kineosphaera limosa]|uniref:methionine synthase n=1 Tax=Kineosphaera limosa TaxID=111564 RepID=UPI00031993D7|nr:methionine synthase [Kineosphaera limosa]NYE03200.1 5-methyltetrahydrofolate--homocysteine methyltransferase [Kineosphaera limosa]
MSSRSESPARPDLRSLLNRRVIVADGAMGTMLQAADPSLEDFQNLEGCNEILNVTRPDIVRSVHAEYLQVGVDAIETNTFGANLANLGEYDIPERIYELAEAGARIAREVADEYSTPDKPRFVLGSIGPGTKLPSLLHAPYAVLRDAYEQCAIGLIDGGADALLVETSQDLLQAKAAIVGCKRALADRGADLPIIASVTIETTGTMLMGSEIGAALTALEPLGIDVIGLNCATGPAEMSEHLRHLATHARVPISCLPNAGLPQLGKDGAHYPLTPAELAAAHTQFVRDYGLALVGGCCGTTPEHLKAVVEAVGGQEVAPRTPVEEAGVASLYTAVPFRQDASYLSIGERTNANGSKAFRVAMLEQRWDDCVEIAKDMTREGAHLLDVCVDYVGRDGAGDMSELVSRLATSSTLPLVLDSTEPAVVEAGLERLGGRAVINSVNYEDGDGPGSRFAKMTALATEHGAALVALTIDEEGQARTAEKKVAIASRLIDSLVEMGFRVEDIIVDALTFPIATGQEETRRDGIETIEAIREITTKYPGVQTTLGVSNVSFGLKPAARVVLNSVFLDEAAKAGLSSAIVNSAKILPVARIPEDQLKVALDLVWDRREFDDAGECTYDPLARMLELFEGVDSASLKASRAAELEALPLGERLQRRIIDGERNGLEADLDEALSDGTRALDIINDHLLAGMKVVGELFGSGKMQLPFVLQSAETMKAAVAHLEPTIEEQESASGSGGSRAKAKVLLATVKGDVHDIGKNLVDIILSNNGYDVVNIGIKKTVNEIIDAATEHEVDAIGMSGLLVKSTVVMKDNLEEFNSRGLASKWPVMLGGAALTRAYVEQDLAEIYDGHVRYARDAFEGLRLMDAIARAKNDPSVSLDEALPELRKRRVRAVTPHEEGAQVTDTKRSNVADDNEIPTPPFWGTRIVKGVALADYSAFLDERATFLGQWGLKPTRGGDGPDYEELVETEGRPRLRMWLDRIKTEDIMEPSVVYGYFPCYSENNDLVVVWHEDGPNGEAKGSERARFSFPRQRRDRRLCLADFFRSKAQYEADGRPDVLALQLVTMGTKVSDVTAKLYAENAYRDYLELHGLSVQLTEALAEFWHARVRSEIGFADAADLELDQVLDVRFRGCRYSFGYPACPELEDRATLVRLLEPERIGVELSEELQLHPEQSTDAMVVHHPEAKYFKV